MSVFSQKGYERVAAVLRYEYDHFAELSQSEYDEGAEGALDTIENITASLADMFKADNPRFKRARFYQAALGRDTVRPVSTVETDREERDSE